MNRLVAGAVAVIALALAVAGCGSGSDPEPVTSSLLAGKGFEEVSTTLDIPEGKKVRILFEKRELSFDAGCNHQFGGYRIEDGVLETSGFGTTLVGCPGPEAKREDLVARFLAASPSLELDGEELVISGPKGELRLRDKEVANPGEKWLHGEAWSDLNESGDVIRGVVRGLAKRPNGD